MHEMDFIPGFKSRMNLSDEIKHTLDSKDLKIPDDMQNIPDSKNRIMHLLQWMIFYEQNQCSLIMDDAKSTFLNDFWKVNFWRKPIDDVCVWNFRGSEGVYASNGGISIKFPDGHGGETWYSGIGAAVNAVNKVSLDCDFNITLIGPKEDFSRLVSFRFILKDYPNRCVTVNGHVQSVRDDSCDKGPYRLCVIRLDLTSMRTNFSVDLYTADLLAEEKTKKDLKMAQRKALGQTIQDHTALPLGTFSDVHDLTQFFFDRRESFYRAFLSRDDDGFSDPDLMTFDTLYFYFSMGDVGSVEFRWFVEEQKYSLWWRWVGMDCFRVINYLLFLIQLPHVLGQIVYNYVGFEASRDSRKPKVIRDSQEDFKIFRLIHVWGLEMEDDRASYKVTSDQMVKFLTHCAMLWPLEKTKYTVWFKKAVIPGLEKKEFGKGFVRSETEWYLCIQDKEKWNLVTGPLWGQSRAQDDLIFVQELLVQ